VTLLHELLGQYHDWIFVFIKIVQQSVQLGSPTFIGDNYCEQLGWCQQREKIDWQEPSKFDCQLVRTIFIFCCPSSIFTRHWRLARKSNFDF